MGADLILMLITPSPPRRGVLDVQHPDDGVWTFCSVYKPRCPTAIRSPPFETDIEAAYGNDICHRALVRPRTCNHSQSRFRS